MISKRRVRELFLPFTAMALLGVAGPAAELLELSETELFFELNDTDGDLGVHASIDGGPHTATYPSRSGIRTRSGLDQMVS